MSNVVRFAPPGVVDLRLYSPRWYQRELHRARKRFNVWVCHRRYGKTVAVVNELIREIVLLAVAGRQDIRAGYVAPFKKQARKIAWQYVKTYTRRIPGMVYKETELEAWFPGGHCLSLYGTDKNPDSIRGEYFDIVAIDETAQVGPRVWEEIIRPMLADREGSAIFIGTPFGRRNLFHRLYEYAANDPEWGRAFYTCDDTDAISDAELDSLRRGMPEHKYAQEMLCDWDAAIEGAYYARQLTEAENQGRIRDVTFDRALPVVTSWDFGVADPTVVVYWQMAGSEIRCLGADAIADVSLPEILAQVKNSRPYSWGRHFVPHDTARRAYEVQGLPTRTDIAAEHGFHFEQIPTKSIGDGIDAVKRHLPRVVFDREGCAVLLEAMRLYRAEYDDVRQVSRPVPVHDWTSHYADAVRTFFQALARLDTPEWDANFDQHELSLDRMAI